MTYYEDDAVAALAAEMDGAFAEDAMLDLIRGRERAYWRHRMGGVSEFPAGRYGEVTRYSCALRPPPSYRTMARKMPLGRVVGNDQVELDRLAPWKCAVRMPSRSPENCHRAIGEVPRFIPAVIFAHVVGGSLHKSVEEREDEKGGVFYVWC